MLNKEIGKLCFYLSMNFIHLGDASCKEAQTAISHFHNLAGKSHKRCIFKHKCAICPLYCARCSIQVYSGTKMFSLSCCFVRPLCIFCHSTVHYCTFAWLFLYFNTVSYNLWVFLVWKRLRVEYVIWFISFNRGGSLQLCGSAPRIPDAFLLFHWQTHAPEMVCKQYCITTSFNPQIQFVISTLNKELVRRHKCLETPLRIVSSVITINLYFCCHNTQMTLKPN